jgi:Uma2 family endonuclease
MSAVLAYYLRRRLPTAAELPHSDETPVDNQLQDDIPQLLKSILQRLWSDRQDWFFAVDMGLYYNPDEPAIVPDAFLSVGVDRFRDVNGRLSYVLWEEENVMPVLALEVVSQKYNSEYEQKLQDYQDLGILYYAIYNPRGGQGRRFRQRSVLEVYKQVGGRYVLQQGSTQPGNPVWMPELNLGLGCEQGNNGGWQRDWLYWYNQGGDRYLTNEELAQQEREQRRLAEERLAALEARLKALEGTDDRPST